MMPTYLVITVDKRLAARGEYAIKKLLVTARNPSDVAGAVMSEHLENLRPGIKFHCSEDEATKEVTFTVVDLLANPKGFFQVQVVNVEDLQHFEVDYSEDGDGSSFPS